MASEPQRPVPIEPLPIAPDPASTMPKAAKITLASVVGAGVALALGVAIPREESGRKVETSLADDGSLVVKHISGKQYLSAYLDVVGVATACDGLTSYRGKKITRDMRFTEAQCAEMLEEELVRHAQGVMRCTPGLALSPVMGIERRREGPRFAAVSLAYNVGVANWCGSTADKRFDAGQYLAGCDAFAPWNKGRVRGKLVPIAGLTARRAREAKVCREGLGAVT